MTIDEAENALNVCGCRIELREQYWYVVHEDRPNQPSSHCYVHATAIKRAWFERFGEKLVLS